MNKKFEDNINKLFKIIALPFSVLWFINSLFLLFSNYEKSVFGIILSFLLPALLFKAALSNKPPWRNKQLMLFFQWIIIIVFVLALYIGLALILIKTLSPYLGETIIGIIFFIAFIASIIFIADYLPDLIKKILKKY